MENKVNQRVIEFINYKKISKLQFCEMNKSTILNILMKYEQN